MNAYHILNIPPSSAPAAIKSAYFKKARETHPDAHPNLSSQKQKILEARFIQINQAYALLINPATRAAHDHKLGIFASDNRSSSQSSAQHASKTPAQKDSAQKGSPQTGKAVDEGATWTKPTTHSAAAPPSDAVETYEAFAEEISALVEDSGALLQQLGVSMTPAWLQQLDQVLNWALSFFNVQTEQAFREKSDGTATAPHQTLYSEQTNQPKEAKHAASVASEQEMEMALKNLKKQMKKN